MIRAPPRWGLKLPAGRTRFSVLLGRFVKLSYSQDRFKQIFCWIEGFSALTRSLGFHRHITPALTFESAGQPGVVGDPVDKTCTDF